MSDAIFGPLITGTDVENAVRDTLKLWAPEYLAWVKRETGRQLPTPRSWITSPDFDRWPEETPPSVLIMSSGTADKPIVEGDGTVRAKYDLGVAIVTQAKTEGAAAELAKLYTAVFVRILTQHRSLGGFANAVDYDGDDWDRMPDRKRKRQLAVGSAEFVVEVSDVLNVRLGPSVPREDPVPVQPDDPTIVQAKVVVQPEETIS
jgi:hypothetical protein